MITTPQRQSELEAIRSALEEPVIFVPTMGALHQGHAALIERAASLSKSVIVSVFINPLQFEDPADLEKYPKTLELDRALAMNAGASFVWAPTFDEVYPGEIERVPAGRVGTILEGAAREGHFDGVLTVVKRLFESVRPQVAIFGEKDFQQLFLVKKLAASMGITIIAHPTVRDENGLALSSRNARLTEEGKQAALVIYRALQEAKVSTIPQERMKEILRSEPRFTLDYATVIDEENFEVVADESHDDKISRRALIAGWIDGVRLIDNLSLENSK